MRIKYIKLYCILIIFNVSTACDDQKKQHKDQTMTIENHNQRRFELSNDESGGRIFIGDLDGYIEFMEDSLPVLTLPEAQKYLNKTVQKQSYYLVSEMYSSTANLSIYFIFSKGDSNGVFVSAFKNGKRISSMDLWNIGEFESFEEVNEGISISTYLNSNKSYTFTVYAPDSYFIITVSDLGQILHEKIDVGEDNIP